MRDQQSLPFDSGRIKLTASINVLNNQNEEPLTILHAVITGLDAIFGGTAET